MSRVSPKPVGRAERGVAAAASRRCRRPACPARARSRASTPRARPRSTTLGAAVDQPLPGGVGVDAGRADPGPERDRLGAQVGADRAPPGAGSRSGGRGRRRAAASARACATGRAGSGRRSRSPRPSPSRSSTAGDRGDPAGQVRRERVEVVVVQGQRDAVVAEVGDDGERVVEPVVGEAVGAVAEPQPLMSVTPPSGQPPATGAARGDQRERRRPVPPARARQRALQRGQRGDAGADGGADRAGRRVGRGPGLGAAVRGAAYQAGQRRSPATRAAARPRPAGRAAATAAVPASVGGRRAAGRRRCTSPRDSAVTV